MFIARLLFFEYCWALLVTLVLNIRIHDANQKTSHKSDISISTWNTNNIEYKSHGVKCNNLNDPEVINIQSVLASSNFIAVGHVVRKKKSEKLTSTGIL